jgi:hypothetical protein
VRRPWALSQRSEVKPSYQLFFCRCSLRLPNACYGQDVPLRSKLSLPDDYAAPSSSLSRPSARLFEHSLRKFACPTRTMRREFERAEAQHFAALIAHGIFSAVPVLEVISTGLPRSRRQLAGL